MPDHKIDFFLRSRAGGGFIARAHSCALEAEGDTLTQLRQDIKRVVRAQFGDDQPVCLRVGETRHQRDHRVAALEAAALPAER